MDSLISSRLISILDVWLWLGFQLGVSVSINRVVRVSVRLRYRVRIRVNIIANKVTVRMGTKNSAFYLCLSVPEGK